MKYVVFDIETHNSSETAKDWIKKDENEFPPIHVHRVQTIGYVIIDTNKISKPVSIHAVQLNPEFDIPESELSLAKKASDYITLYVDEMALLLHFIQDVVSDSDSHATYKPMSEKDICLVSQHGSQFDLPVILTRCFSHSIRTDWYYGYKENKFTSPTACIVKPKHIDIKHEFANGMFKGHSLDQMSQIAGLPGKGEVDGSKTFELFNEGKVFTIAEYCISDVVKTAFIFLKHCLLSAPFDNWNEIFLAMTKLKEEVQLSASQLPAMDKLMKESNWEKYNPQWSSSWRS